MVASEINSAVTVLRANERGRFLFVCEHASNILVAPWDDLGLTKSDLDAHIAWDPGALAVAKGLSERLASPLVYANFSRLIYDLNRPPQAVGAMPARSEVFDIPGNRTISPEDRWGRTEAIYVPFHAALRRLIAQRLALGLAPVMVTIHSFTPVFNGQSRSVEFGVIHDADPDLPLAVLAEAKARTNLDARLNEPYSAADGVTHTLALQATPLGVPCVMLEIRNDLISTPEMQDAMADLLAPVLMAALDSCETPKGQM